MNAEELAAIRAILSDDDTGYLHVDHARALLAHIDALTAKVGDLDPYDDRHTADGDALVPQSAVLAILRGE